MKKENNQNFKISSEMLILLNDLQKKLKIATRSQLIRYALWSFLKQHGIISEVPDPFMGIDEGSTVKNVEN